MIWRQILKRGYEDSDGVCCMYHIKRGCISLTNTQETCGTYSCPFYKPIGCGDWVRRDGDKHVWLIPPEELGD